MAAKTRTLAQTVALTDSAARTRKKLRSLAETVGLTDTLTRATSKARSLAETISISDFARITIHVARTIVEAAITITDAVAAIRTTPQPWILSGKLTDFPDKIDNLVNAYLVSKWSATVTPQIGTSLTTAEAQIDNFAYDKFRTYYIRIEEGKSRVINRQIRQRLYEFETPVNLECSVRSLSKGETFTALNDMINELMRIFAEFAADDIFGVQGITLDSITPIGNDSPNKTVYQKTLKIILHYYKIDNS
jgi:hypothetical protein